MFMFSRHEKTTFFPGPKVSSISNIGSQLSTYIPVTNTMIIVFFVLVKILNVSTQDIYGFDFEDNKVPKYLTENNGVAEISVKG